MIWQEIDYHISQITGEKFVSNQHLSISGGCINQSYAISNSKIIYFIKQNLPSQGSMFAAEMLGLQQIYQSKTIPSPKPICWGITETSSYIVLEWLEMTNGNHKSWTEMGRKLAAMHKITTNKGFGWDINNTIGSTPQINNFHSSWTEFYTQNRLNYQFQLAKKRGGKFPHSAKLLAAIPQLFLDYKIQPSLEERGLKIALETKAVLGKNLMGKIQKEGTLAAFKFCNVKAIPLTDSMSIANNVNIKRVSDKPRNLKNKATSE